MAVLSRYLAVDEYFGWVQASRSRHQQCPNRTPEKIPHRSFFSKQRSYCDTDMSVLVGASKSQLLRPLPVAEYATSLASRRSKSLLLMYKYSKLAMLRAQLWHWRYTPAHAERHRP